MVKANRSLGGVDIAEGADQARSEFCHWCRELKAEVRVMNDDDWKGFLARCREATTRRARTSPQLPQSLPDRAHDREDFIPDVNNSSYRYKKLTPKIKSS
jgi:hypothetical protein